MALRRQWAYVSIVFGFLILALTIGCVVGGAVAIGHLDDALASGGLWALYYLIPVTMLLVAGFARYFGLFAITIGANAVGILLAFAGIIYCAGAWEVLSSTCVESSRTETTCVCNYDLYDEDGTFSHDGSCSDVDTARDANAAVTIFYVLLFILSFVATVLGSVAACCDRRAHFHRRHGHYYDSRKPNPFVIPYDDPHAIKVTRLLERTRVEDPYYRPPRYVRELNRPASYYYHNLRLEGRPYTERPPGRIVENPLVQERRYNHDPPNVRAPPLPYRKNDEDFAGYKNKPHNYSNGDIYMW